MNAAVGRWFCLAALFVVFVCASVAEGADSEWNRKSLAGLQAVYVLVEELQPNVQRYAPKVNLSKDQLRNDIEAKLAKAGIRTLSTDDWLKTKGKPTLYVNVNTHQYEKYSYAYDIRLEFQQVVQMEVNPAVKLLADTWSINQTGVFNVGSVGALRDHLNILMDRFIEAYQWANQKKVR